MNRIRNHPMAALGVLGLGLFMTLLDLTIVNIAIPSIVDGVHAGLDEVLWMLNGYSLAYAVLLITFGRIGDIVGPRTMFIAGVLVFVAASAFSGVAQNSAVHSLKAWRQTPFRSWFSKPQFTKLNTTDA